MQPEQPQAGPRRVVLIDFDWQDADLLPALLRQPGLRVQLVAGEKAADPGLRAAELCGVPRTVELADLTRQIFDLALIGERSARRQQVERLLVALGTPVCSPQAFLDGPIVPRPGAGAGPAAAQVPLPPAFDGDLAERLAQVLPDLSQPPRASGGSGARPAAATNRPEIAESSRRETAAPARAGSGAPLRDALEGPGPEAFRPELDVAVEHGLRGRRYSLVRIRLGDVPEPVAVLCRRLPARVRDGDILCRPAAQDVLLLLAGSRGSPESLRGRVAGLWEEAWLASRCPSPTPPIAEEWIDLSGPQDVERFRATAGRWLAAHASDC